MAGKKDAALVKAVTGLEGGVVGSGSTCGIVSAGALGLALIHEDRLDVPGSRDAIRDRVRQYARWYAERSGTTLCRERTGVDFHSMGGQLAYFINPARLYRCFADIGGAVFHLHSVMEQIDRAPVEVIEDAAAVPDPLYCAGAVLAGVREATGMGDLRLERIAFVFDGGVGLSGNVCGALAGAVMATNLLFGVDSRTIGRKQTIGGFLIGHLNLFARERKQMPEPYGIGKRIVDEFRQTTGGPLECRAITGTEFDDYNDFQDFMAGSKTCQDLIESATQSAIDVIERWR